MKSEFAHDQLTARKMKANNISLKDFPEILSMMNPAENRRRAKSLRRKNKMN
jgi:hypothetical protein